MQNTESKTTECCPQADTLTKADAAVHRPRRGAIGKALLVWLATGSIGAALIAYLAFGAMGC